MGVPRLHRLALERSEQAVASGALCPLTTRVEPWHGSDAESFELRSLIGAPPRHLLRAGPKPNPFRPWDQRLELEPVGGDHVLILNKYPVQIGHMLLITRDWAPQTGWLSPLDWQAVHSVRQHSSGLWFFNSGPRAGASQPHRHLQLLPREPGQPLCPRATWWESKLLGEPEGRRRDRLDERTSVVALSSATAETLHEAYLTLCQAQGMGHPSVDAVPRNPYNLLFCERWMGLVSRSHDECNGFSINALGFAGYLLCTDHSDRPWLDQHGPGGLLNQVVSTADFSDTTDVPD